MADAALVALSAKLGAALKARGQMLALAESCTGGMAAQYVTAIPGSSAWFDRGFVTYSNFSKQEMLLVPGEILAEHGAVSEETARSMVLGALQQSTANLAGAITGIAGPDGGTAEKPVGTVCFGWADRSGRISTTTHLLTGDRHAIRQQSVLTLLKGLLEFSA
jgi:nicotinamide-nucleotide amidase